MKLLIHGRNLDVTSALRDYTEAKLERAVQHYNDMVVEADVHLSVARNPRVPQQTAEVTVFANGTVIRAQERSENLYASIDLVANKLTRQLRRYKERHSDHHHSAGIVQAQLPRPKRFSTTHPWMDPCWKERKPIFRIREFAGSISRCRRCGSRTPGTSST